MIVSNHLTFKISSIAMSILLSIEFGLIYQITMAVPIYFLNNSELEIHGKHWKFSLMT